MKEIRKQIQGFPDYEVSNLGYIYRIRSNPKSRLKVGDRLKNVQDNDDYLVVSLCHKGKIRRVKVHKLIATVFIPKPQILELNGDELVEVKLEVNRKDFNKHNNRSANLEWLTHVENTAHATRGNRYKRGEEHHGALLTLQDVQSIRRKIKRGWKQTEVARYYNVARPTISDIVWGRTWGG